MFKGRFSRAVVAATTAASLAVTGAVVFITEQNASAATCTAVLFVGVRGSGEATGLGPSVQNTYDVFKSKTTKSVTVHALPYTAAPVPIINKGASISAFVNSVNSGKTMLVDYLTAQSKQCPSQDIVLAGFSQGALVVNQAMRTLPVSILERVDGLALIADPAFDPKFAGNVGTYSKNDEGIVSTFTSVYKTQNYLPATVSGKAKAYCLAYDPVCNYSVVSLTNCAWSGKKCTHNLYIAKGYTRQAGEHLAARI
jgi:hypothetical protein